MPTTCKGAIHKTRPAAIGVRTAANRRCIAETRYYQKGKQENGQHDIVHFYGGTLLLGRVQSGVGIGVGVDIFRSKSEPESESLKAVTSQLCKR